MAKKKKVKKLFDDLTPKTDPITRAPKKIPEKDEKKKQLPKVKRQAGGALKPIDPETQPGLAALKKESPETVNKMGYAKKGGRIVSAMTGGQIVSMMYDD
tara:strand:+ start:316 stop:615 length:300 start_codon:yes stop_codon:yes gene_type:complete